ncbi:MAG: FHA domain-containing protein [Deltaproteobacteria bacterium]|nr:FHA domain-containing protein [Deltaproteobacteria bacterium]
MASQRVYESQLKETLKKQGRASYEKLYPDPFLVFLGLAGQLDAHVSAEATTVAVPNADVLEVNSLVGRVFFLATNGRGGTNVTVGRDAQNDVAIPEYSISKRHCEFLLEAGHISLRDVGSTNGTEVNGSRLVPGQAHKLVAGDMIMMGRFAFRFHLPRSFCVP